MQILAQNWTFELVFWTVQTSVRNTNDCNHLNIDINNHTTFEATAFFFKAKKFTNFFSSKQQKHWFFLQANKKSLLFSSNFNLFITKIGVSYIPNDSRRKIIIANGCFRFVLLSELDSTTIYISTICWHSNWIFIDYYRPLQTFFSLEVLMWIEMLSMGWCTNDLNELCRPNVDQFHFVRLFTDCSLFPLL